MPAIASIEDLTAAQVDLQAVKFTAKQIETLKKWGPKVGWKNVMHMVCYGRTPKQLKSGERGE